MYRENSSPNIIQKNMLCDVELHLIFVQKNQILDLGLHVTELFG